MVPIDHRDAVLAAAVEGGWVTVELEPMSKWRSTVKRVFDVVFSISGLISLTPLIVLIAVLIKLDSCGPVFYTQKRTGFYGQCFQLPKFRTMYPKSENPIPEEDEENDRITPLGRSLRKTHLDEIPQLWSILRGEMSVVGPRAVWTEEERILRREVDGWQRRYFVKPGLTGLAQINGASSTEASDKLQHDLTYIHRQTLLLDVWIVLTQIRIVMRDVRAIIATRLQR